MESSQWLIGAAVRLGAMRAYEGRGRMALIEARFKLEKETKGAVRYHEVDEKGEIEQTSAKIGALYLRKTAFERGEAYPQSLRVIVEAVE
jgi:hypothetical protein